MPPPSALGYLSEISTNTLDPPLADLLGIQAPANPKDIPPVTIGASLPPVPGKLVKRIEAGNFIEMGEFLPEWLGAANISTDDDEFKAPKPKPRLVSTILEWAQCFGIYVAEHNLNEYQIYWPTRLLSSRPKWNTRVTAGRVMIEHFVSELCLGQTLNSPL